MQKKFLSKFVASLLVFAMTIGYIPVTSVFASGMTYSPQNFGLTLHEGTSSNGKVNYTMDWEPVSFKYNDDGSVPTTRYYLARRKIDPTNSSNTSGEYKWELRGNYSDEGVSVLNIYPDAGDGLQSWMSSISNSSESNGFDVNINVDKQSLSDFNKNPEAKLKKAADGSYNYDVVVFGFWDSNNHVDISKSYTSSGTSAYQVMDDYIKSGYGVIFGHDTTQMDDPSRNPNFTELLTNNSSFTVVPRNEDGWHYSEKIAVKQQGSLTTYPFDIYGKSLIIPMTHNVNQLATDPSTVYMTFEKNYYPSGGDGPYYNYNVNGAKDTVMYGVNEKTYVGEDTFDVTKPTEYLPANSYLMKDDNVAFIQCGHSSGKTSTTEQMIIANTIYSLKQMIKGTHSIDQVLDTEKPEPPIPSVSGSNQLSFTANDIGSEYKYRVIAAPVGLSIYDEWENIQDKLENPDIHDYTYDDGRMVAFSQIAETGEVKAEIKSTNSFEYYVDRKATGEKRDGAFINADGTYTLPALNTITKDSYLHIWSYDNANNVSFERTTKDGSYLDAPVPYTVSNGITNINLWDIYERLTATVKYEDMAGGELKVPVTSEEMLGSVFAPAIPNIPGYRYNSSVPANKITIAEGSDNTVTHKYDELLSKQIKVVIHDGDTPQVVNYKTVNGIATDKYIIDLPESYNSYDYAGYYTVGDSTTGIEYTLGTELEITNSDTLYVHYIPKEKSFNVIVKDEKNDIEYANFSVTGYVGHTTVVLPTYIQSNITGLNDYTAYQNYEILNETLYVDVTETTLDQVIVLIPRTKRVLYLGYDFPSTIRTTSASALSSNSKQSSRDGAKLLVSKDYTFNGTDTIVEIEKNPAETAGYTFLNGTAHTTDGDKYYIDFTNKINTVSMTYYKGTLPSDKYTINTRYLNQADNRLMPTISGILDSNPFSMTADLKNQGSIPIVDYHNVINTADPDDPDYSYFPDGTDFEVDTVKITRVNKLGESEEVIYYATDDINDNIYEFMPDIDSNGDLLYDTYNVDVTYKPYGSVTFNEYLCDTNTPDKSSSLKTKEYKKLYGEDVELKGSFLPYPHEVYKVVVDGVKLDATELANFDFTTTVDDYTKTIDVYYRPLTYDLTVRAGSSDSVMYDIYTYTDVAYNRATKFTAPELSGYTFTGGAIEGIAPAATLTTEGNNVTFDPNKVEGDYTVCLNYAQDAEVDITYVVFDYDSTGKPTEVHTTAVKDGLYVGEEIDVRAFNVPGHTLSIAYMDEKVIDINAGEDYAYKVDSPMTKAYLIYTPTAEYPVTLKANPVAGGDVSGNKTVAGDNLFHPGSRVTINATANPGYQFVNWTTSDVTLENSSSLATSFIMPDKAVTITANFKSTTGNGGGGGDTGGGGGGNIVKPIEPEKPINPPEIIFPERPVDPGDPGNIIDLIEDPTGKIIRMYEPYIQGYPEGDVRPSGTITRAEVMQVIYNLYGYGLYRDSYGDKSAVNAYNDVEYDEWYSDAIAFCLDYGVINGYSDGTIRPDEPITRAELSAIIAKLIIGDVEYTSSLTDIDDSWAKDAIEKLHANGIINGYPDGSFKPNQTTIRSEFTVMVNRLIDRAEEYHKNVTFPDLPESHWAYDDMMNAANGGVVQADNAQEVLDNLEKNKQN